MSQLVASGQLVVFAQADGPMPLPLEVNGDRIEGEGVTFYQFALPLNRDQVVSPPKPLTTRPTTGPATRPGGKSFDVPETPSPNDAAAKAPAPLSSPLAALLDPARGRWRLRAARW